MQSKLKTTPFIFILAGIFLATCKPMSKVSSKSYVGKEFETETGLRYTIYRAGTGERAEAGKIVSVHYAGRLPDSTEFDNSYKKGNALRFELGKGQVIKGWEEGIALLNVGDSAILVVPPHLAYGDQQRGSIPANSTLTFTVELLDVKEPAAQWKATKPDTVHVQEGLSIIWFKRNPEGKSPAVGNSVKVHYSGFFKNGKKFDSSVDRGEALAFPIGQGQVIPGWDLGIAQLKTGEKAKLIIAPELGYGSRGYPNFIPPNADLIFDVELLEIY